jgi:hypothetical protein
MFEELLRVLYVYPVKINRSLLAISTTRQSIYWRLYGRLYRPDVKALEYAFIHFDPDK